MRQFIGHTAPGWRACRRLILGLSLSGIATTSLAVPISSEVFTLATVSLSTTVPVDDEVTAADSQGAGLGPLSAAALATVSDGTDTATASVGVEASWTNANEGTVVFDDSFETISPTGFVQGFLQPFGRFSYTFVADADGTLSVAYDRDLTFAPNELGTGLGYSVSVTGFPLFRTGFGVTDPGLFTFDLLGGNAYRFVIQTGMGLGGNIGRRSATSRGTFDWAFEPLDGPVLAPEPGTLALLGLALLGSVLARRARSTRRCSQSVVGAVAEK